MIESYMFVNNKSRTSFPLHMQGPHMSSKWMNDLTNHCLGESLHITNFVRVDMIPLQALQLSLAYHTRYLFEFYQGYGRERIRALMAVFQISLLAQLPPLSNVRLTVIATTTLYTLSVSQTYPYNENVMSDRHTSITSRSVESRNATFVIY